MDVLTKEQRHINMSNIRSKDTKAEITLRKALWYKGIRYRKNYAILPGKPDIALTKYKIAIFCDGDFWHGKGFEHPGEQVHTNRTFWMNKLGSNIERDKEVNDQLLAQGWLVLRFWESDIEKDLDGCVEKILAYLP
jgi:DNA mismatch endonuclease (patch repair protein)